MYAPQDAAVFSRWDGAAVSVPSNYHRTDLTIAHNRLYDGRGVPKIQLFSAKILSVNLFRY